MTTEKQWKAMNEKADAMAKFVQENKDIKPSIDINYMKDEICGLYGYSNPPR
ncbi:MAG: hypothetical protein NHB32_21140 [Fischerella sp. CENA71]|nr:hypothetical protein [Fischerella sp. CENA71]